MKKLLSFVLVVVMTVSLAASAIVINVGAESNVSVWNGTAASTSLAGSGTKDDPYLIQSAADLKYLANAVNANYNTTGGNTFAGKYIKQTVDIDLAGKTWTPIGYREYAVFQGVYDGDGHSIVGLANNGTISYRNGLFGGIGAMGRDGTNNGQGTNIPAAAPYECGIANLTVEGNISLHPNSAYGTAFMSGGLVSFINDEHKTSATTVYITNVVSSVNLTASGFGGGVMFGGICGMAYNAVFENVVNNGNVTVEGTRSSYHSAGGFAGRAENCEFVSCVNNGDIYLRATASDNSPRVGGFVGQYYKKLAEQTLTFTNCVNNGDVTAKFLGTTARNTFAGGILGAVYYNIGGSYAAETWASDSSKKWSDFKVSFTNCVNTGTISASRPYVTSTGGCTAGGILSTTYSGNGADKNNGGFLFDGCVNVGAVHCSEKDRGSGIVSCIFTDWSYSYNIKVYDCMTGSKSAYPEIDLGNKAVVFSGSCPDNIKAEITGTNTENASTFNTSKAASLVSWNNSLVLPSVIDINGMPTSANVAILTGTKNVAVDLPYAVPATMVVTDAEGNPVSEITTPGKYIVKLALTGVTPYVTDQFALKYGIAYVDDYFDINSVVMKFTFKGNDRICSLTNTVADLNAWTEDVSTASGMFYNILPRNLGSKLTMTLTYNGETLITYDYSLVTYVENQLAKTAAQIGLSAKKKTQLDNLLVDMLKYSAEDQRLNGIAEDKLVTKNLTEQQLALGSEFSTEGLVNVKGLSTTDEYLSPYLHWTSVALLFDNTISMRFRFAIDSWIVDDYSSEALGFVVATNGNSVGVSNLESLGYDSDTGCYNYYIDVTGFSPTEYDDSISITFSIYGSTSSYTVTYSVDSYLLAKNESATYGALVRALASYRLSVEAFLG